jgi:hypothetical protein
MEKEQTNPIIEQLNQSLSETLVFLKSTGSATIDFSKEQIPLYIQELLSYNFVSSLFFFCIGVTLIFIGLYHLYKLVQFGKTEWLVPFRYNDKAIYKHQIIPNPTKEDWEKCADPKNTDYCLRPPETQIIISIIAAFFCAFISFVFFIHNTDWVKIKLAPRVYIVEQIKQLVK